MSELKLIDMDFPAALFDGTSLWVANGVALLLLVVCGFKIRWRALNTSALNAWMGACVLCMGMWLLRGGLLPGLSFHLLGAALFTLLMGPWMALLALAIVMSGLAAGGAGDWQALGLNWLCTALPPVLLTALSLWLSQRHLAPHLFIYVFVNGFLTGGASLFLASLAGILLLGAGGVYDWDVLLSDTLPFYFLLAWSEAFTTGLLLAVLVVYRPEWVSTFDDDRYLGRRPG